jgi:hypothetical protein
MKYLMMRTEMALETSVSHKHLKRLIAKKTSSKLVAAKASDYERDK